MKYFTLFIVLSALSICGYMYMSVLFGIVFPWITK